MNLAMTHDKSTPTPAKTVAVWDTQTLFKNAREVRLRHAGAEYRLQITRNGKLILIK